MIDPKEHLERYRQENSAPVLRWHLGIFAMIVLLASLSLGAMYFLGVSLFDYVLGFFTGIGLYSLFWRWRYGFWPD